MENTKSARKGLGRGLSALLGEDPMGAASTSAGGPRVETVALTDLEPNPDQPRKMFADEEIESLAGSLRTKGLLQPIVVRDNPRGTTLFEIVAGERRWRASQRAPLHDVPVIVLNLTDAEALEVALVENVQRVNLNPVEEAESYSRLIDFFGYTQEQLAETVTKSRSHIANTLRLMKLPPRVQQYLREGELSAGHARALIGHADAEKLAREIVENKLSVRDAEKRAAKVASPNPPKGEARGKHPKDADTMALEGSLSAALGAKVELAHTSAGSGTLTVRYRSLSELDEICEKMGLG